jgi:DNA polymerase-3 subunit gamma/tau
VADVAADAALGVDAKGLAHAVRSARGSARDALSALDRVVAGGMTVDDTTTTDLLEAIADQNTGRALAALATGITRGREPRVLGEALLGGLREAFLVTMGVPVEQLGEADREQARVFAERVTPAVITRSLETLGAALIDMRRAPDPRVDLEVALVRLTRTVPAEAPSKAVAELALRVERLEATLAEFRGPVGGSAPPPPAAARSKEGPAARAREVLAEKAAPVVPPPPPADDQAEAQGPDDPSTVPTMPVGDLPDRDELALAWADEILPILSKKARARFTAGRFVAVEDGAAVFGLPNEPHMRRCSEMVGDMEAALASRFGVTVPVRMVVDDGRSAKPAPPRPSTPTAPTDDEVDLTGLVDADATAGSAIEKLTEAFPGARLVDSE